MFMEVNSSTAPYLYILILTLLLLTSAAFPGALFLFPYNGNARELKNRGNVKIHFISILF